MKKNIYLSYIDSESMNYKNKITDRFKGRKYKHSEATFTTANTTFEPGSDASIKLAKNVSRADVTVVLISRSILESTWIPLEVGYSLKGISTSKAKPQPKGVIGVVIPDKGNDYSYMMKKGMKGIWMSDKKKLPNVIAANMHNEKVLQNKHDINYDSFISVYRWEDFIRDFENCINVAYDKATNHFEDYNISSL